ncbi:hypothetical protein Tco_0797602 [Tanacetum coccineum]
MTRKQESDALFWKLLVSNEDYELKSDKIINGDNVVVALIDENGYWKMKEDGDDAVVGTGFGSGVGVPGPVVDSDVIGVGNSNLENAVGVNPSDLENVAPLVHVGVGSSINLGSVEEFEGVTLVEKAADLVQIEESKKELGTEMDSIKDDGQVNAERKRDANHVENDPNADGGAVNNLKNAQDDENNGELGGKKDDGEVAKNLENAKDGGNDVDVHVGDLENIDGEKTMEKAADSVKIEENKKELETDQMDLIKDEGQVNAAERKRDTDHDGDTSSNKGLRVYQRRQRKF